MVEQHKPLKPATDSTTSQDEEDWHSTVESVGCENFRQRLFKDIFIGVIAVVFVIIFVNWPEEWIVVSGVAVVITLAWLSERKPRVLNWWPPAGRAVVITGCDTGFGHVLAMHLDRLGVRVFAGCLHANGPGALKLKEECSERLHVLQMDVTNYEQVAQCATLVDELLEGVGLWGLVNNAGLNFLGDIELTTVSQFENVVNVNQLGMIRVTKAFLPLIRRRKGRIVNITSVRGRIAEPFTGAYASTKFATEAFSDILRLEMKKFGVNVSIVEPGNFGGATDSINMDRIRSDFESMWTQLSESQRSDYGREYIDYHTTFIDSTRPMSSYDLTPVTHGISDALFANKPRYRYLIPGGSGWYDAYRWKILIQPYLPTWLMDYVLMRDYTHFPKPATLC